MKTKISLILFLFVLLGTVAVSLQGLTTWNVPGDKTTLASAITSLNALGTVTDSYVINLVAANPQTTPIGGYIITASGTETNTITIQGNNNTITAYSPQAIAVIHDAIFEIDGGDYITIKDFVMRENPANTAYETHINNMTEFGVAIFYANATNGAKNITIQNNTISLSLTCYNTFGIFATDRHTSTAPSVVADITAASGAHDNLHIYGNHISTVNLGIVSVGSYTTAFMPVGLDIGGTSATTGNSISNFGLTTGFSTYQGVSKTLDGISLNNHLEFNIQYNTISSNLGVNLSGTMRGIYATLGGTAPTEGNYLRTASHNSISLKQGASGQIYGIHFDIGSAYFSTNVDYNDFHDISYNLTNSGSQVFLISPGESNISSISNNTFTNLAINTGQSVYLISDGKMPLATSVHTISNNRIVTGLSKASGSSLYCVYTYSACTAGSSFYIENNDFSNITLVGSASLYGIYNYNYLQGHPNKYIRNNTLTNWTNDSNSMFAISVNNGGYTEITGNAINTLTSGYWLRGVDIGTGGTSSGIKIEDNDIHGLQTPSYIWGIYNLAPATVAAVNIGRNKLYDFTCTGTGYIQCITAAGYQSNIYSNLIYDIKVPIMGYTTYPVIKGIHLSTNTNNNVYYNSIYLNSSGSSAYFSATAIAIYAGSNNDICNNIFVNTCVPGASGRSTAIWKTTDGSESIGANSNKNIYWTGENPGASNPIGYFNTTAYPTLAEYKAALVDRDQGSYTEDVPFVSDSGVIDLHIASGIPTAVEGNAMVIAGYTKDIDNEDRSATTPDIGADEGTFGPLADFPAGASTQVEIETGVFITINPSITLNYAADQTLPELPSGSFTPLYHANLTGSGIVDIVITTDAPWGAYRQGGQWYAVANGGTSITFSNVDFDAKGDVPIVLGDTDPTLPVTLSAFTATLSSTYNAVTLNWTVESETNHAGYNVLRNTELALSNALCLNSSLISNGTQIGSQISYSLTDTELETGTTYYYWLQSMDLSGASHFYGPLTVLVTGNPENPETPETPFNTALMSAFPNPFNPNTTLRYSIREAGMVNIDIYNMRGQLVRSFKNNHNSPGFYQIDWNGKDSSGLAAGSGMYFYRMSTNNFSSTKKMIMSK